MVDPRFDVGGVQIHVGKPDVVEAATAEHRDSSSMPAQMRDTVDFDTPTRSPARTKSSTFLVEVPVVWRS